MLRDHQANEVLAGVGDFVNFIVDDKLGLLELEQLCEALEDVDLVLPWDVLL